MGRYLIRRLLIAIPSLVGISVVLFTVLALAPGDPFEELATNPNVPAAVRAALRVKFGLDDPIAIRYLRWFTAMLHGDWGFSFVSRIDVDVLILQRLPTTLFVIGSSQVLALLIALPVGIYAAARPYSIFDEIASTLAFVGFSLPTFFTGILFILIFSIYLDWLPFVYRTDISATGWQWYSEHIRQAAMPVAVLGPFQGAAWTRYVRSSVLDVIRLDHVTTARAKGLAERDVIMRHVVRNALIPVVTLVALQMLAVEGSAILTLIFLTVVLGPLWGPVPINDIDFTARLAGPSWQHPFGPDDLGQDLLARLLYGGRISLAVGLAAMVIAVVAGTIVGAIAGISRGSVDAALMWFTDLFLSLPQLPLLLLIIYLFRDSLKDLAGPEVGVFILVVAVIGGFRWMPVARLVRAQFFSLREKEFVEAARALGASTARH